MMVHVWLAIAAKRGSVNTLAMVSLSLPLSFLLFSVMSFVLLFILVPLLTSNQVSSALMTISANLQLRASTAFV